MQNFRCLVLVLLAAAPCFAQVLPPPKVHTTPPVHVSFPPDQPDPIASLRPGHPRLFATADEFDRIAKDTSDPLRAEVVKRVIATAETEIKSPLIPYKITGPSGKVVHDLLLNTSRLVMQKVVSLSMAYRLTHDRRFADRAIQEMVNVSGYKDWTPEEFLATAEMSMAVGIGYDWCYDAMSPADRATIKGALMDKALVFIPPLYSKILSVQGDLSDWRLWWVIGPNNWNQVCNSGILVGALAVAEDEPDLARLAVRGMRTYLPISMHSYGPDGAYPEGPGYWAYGSNYNVLGINALVSVFGTDYGLSEVEPPFAKTDLFRLHMQSPDGVIFNYADANTWWENGASPAFGWLAGRFQHPAAIAAVRQDLKDMFAKTPPEKQTDRFFPFHIFWLPPEPKDIGTAQPLDAHFHGDADVAAFRSAWNDPDALYLGFKNGKNGISHSHLDLGTFVLDSDGVRWATELGPESYEVPGFFGDKRFTYYRMNNFCQSTITPGDMLQSKGALAPIYSFTSGDDSSSAVSNLTSAYPKAAQSIYRGVFMLNKARILVQDDLTGVAPNTPLNWRMMTLGKITVAKGGRIATLKQGDKTLRAEILSPANATLSSQPATPPTKEETQNKGYSVLLASVPAASAVADVRIAVLLSPVGAKWPTDLPKPEIKPLPTPEVAATP